jgi:hypothetical protein
VRNLCHAFPFSPVPFLPPTTLKPRFHYSGFAAFRAGNFFLIAFFSSTFFTAYHLKAPFPLQRFRGFPCGFHRDYNVSNALSITLVALPYKMPVENARKAAKPL